MSADYWLSSQSNRWQLSQSQLASSSTRCLEHSDPTKSALYSRDEHLAIGIFLSNSITTICKRLGLRQRCAATACLYSKRFFAKVPYSESPDPCLVASACVYVAAKVEESPVHVRSVCQEAAKVWADLPNASPPPSPSLLAEMEFYLLEELDFDLIVHHAYRSLTSISENFGRSKGKGIPSSSTSNSTSSTNKEPSSSRSNFDSENPTKPAQSQPQPVARGLSSLPPKPGTVPPASSSNNNSSNSTSFGNRGTGGNHSGSSSSSKMMGIEREDGALEEDGEISRDSNQNREGNLKWDADGDQTIDWEMSELDEQALQMAWFIINDTYRTEIPLIYPPYIIAVSALLLALSLHPPARKKLEESWKSMEEKRLNWRKKCEEAGFPISMSTNSQPQLASSSSSSNERNKNSGLNFKDLQSQRPLPPKNDVLTFIASLNISLPIVAQVIQEIMDNYEVWHRVSNPKPSIDTTQDSDQNSTSTIPSINIPFQTGSIPKPEIQIPDGAWGILQEGTMSSSNNNGSNPGSQHSSPNSNTQQKSTSNNGTMGEDIGILKRLENLRERRRLKMIEIADGEKVSGGGLGNQEMEISKGNSKKRKGDEVVDGDEKGKNSKGKRKV